MARESTISPRVREDFTIWFNGSLAVAQDPAAWISGAEVLARFGAFMDGWSDPGEVNRVSVSLLLKRELADHRWLGRKDLRYRPLRWTHLAWRTPTLQETIALHLDGFAAWFDQELELGPITDTLKPARLRDAALQAGVVLPEQTRTFPAPFGLMMRELVRTRGLPVVLLANGAWAGLRWRVEPPPMPLGDADLAWLGRDALAEVERLA